MVKKFIRGRLGQNLFNGALAVEIRNSPCTGFKGCDLDPIKNKGFEFFGHTGIPVGYSTIGVEAITFDRSIQSFPQQPVSQPGGHEVCEQPYPPLVFGDHVRHLWTTRTDDAVDETGDYLSR